MKTILRPPTPVPPPSEEVHVGCTAEGGKVHLFGTGPRHAWRRSFDPAQAVKLWRCLMGEMSTVTPDDEYDDTMKLWHHVDPELGDLWEFVDATGERLFCVDADQAYALAMAIEKCVGIALYTSTPGKEKMLHEERVPVHVWVLAARRVLTGDCCETGVDLIGGYERVFLTENAALDALREFLRPLVNEANTETFWANMTTTVDDILDTVIEPGKRSGWLYNGDKQSFEVTLRQIEVEHGA